MKMIKFIIKNKSSLETGKKNRRDNKLKDNSDRNNFWREKLKYGPRNNLSRRYPTRVKKYQNQLRIITFRTIVW